MDVSHRRQGNPDLLYAYRAFSRSVFFVTRPPWSSGVTVMILFQFFPLRRSTTAVSQILSASVFVRFFPVISGWIPFMNRISERYTFPIPAISSCLRSADPRGSDVFRIFSENCFFPRFPSRSGSGPNFEIWYSQSSSLITEQVCGPVSCQAVKLDSSRNLTVSDGCCSILNFRSFPIRPR